MYTFPQYRKSPNGLNWYKIISEKEFVEIQLIGSKKAVYTIVAHQYPEMLRIQDMLKCNGYVKVDEIEFDNK